MRLFALGLFGVLIATRFLMPAVLMLHIGIGALLIAIGRGWREYSKRRQLILFGPRRDPARRLRRLQLDSPPQ